MIRSILEEIAEKVTRLEDFDSNWSVFANGSALTKQGLQDLLKSDIDILIFCGKVNLTTLDDIRTTLGKGVLGLDAVVDLTAGPVARIVLDRGTQQTLLLQCNVLKSPRDLSAASRLSLHFNARHIAGNNVEFWGEDEKLLARDRRFWIRDLLIARSILKENTYPIWTWSNADPPSRILHRQRASHPFQIEKQFSYCTSTFANWHAALALLKETRREGYAARIGSNLSNKEACIEIVEQALLDEKPSQRESHILPGERADGIDCVQDTLP